MKMTDLIQLKKEKKTLSKDMINYMIKNYTSGKIPDYQMSSMAMAIVLNGMTDEETSNLARAMKDSGDIIDLTDIDGIKVDKHSTGGVGEAYTMTITFTASSGYEWTGLGNMEILASDDIGQTITTSFTSTDFTVTITGEIGIQDQSANITINGTPIYSQAATSITTTPSGRFDFSSGGGYFDVEVVSDGAFVIVTEKDYFEAVPSSGAAGTTLVRVYVDANNTPNARVGNLLFRPRASLTTLTTLTFDQESNLEAQ